MRKDLLLALTLLLTPVYSYATTDTTQDADPPQSGYLPAHNLDQSTLSLFQLNWRMAFNTGEVFYAKPLVYTPRGYSSELVIVVSNQNIVRAIDALTGNVVSSRTLDPPFLASDAQCGDTPGTIGIIGTPYIDPSTDIMYFFSKGYKNGAASGGVLNGQYKFYAVKLPIFTDVQGFPVSLENRYNAQNDRARYFVGGTVLQRPGIASIGDSIVAGFGGQCDNFNYTGMLVTVSKTTGVVGGTMAMVAAPGAISPQPLDFNVQTGGKAGIWQSGMGLAADNNRVFFVTGNGKGPGENGAGVPRSGKKYISTLQQSVVNMGVDTLTGNLTQNDWFAPYEYDSLNGGDRDFGSGGLALLDPAVFFTPTATRLAVTGGKAGKLYIMNADNLGGFMNGDGGHDAVVQTIVQSNSIFGGFSSYPGEGGYIYFSPTANDYLYAYKFNPSGIPAWFTFAGKTAITTAGKSVPTVTSNNGVPGSAIVWIADVNYGILAFNAVPVNGVLTQIQLPTTGRLTKFQRVSFGDKRAYTVSQNTIVAIGVAPGTRVLSSSNVPPATSASSRTTTSSVMSTTSSRTSTSSAMSSSTTSSTTKSSTNLSPSSSNKPTTSSTSTHTASPTSTFVSTSSSSSTVRSSSSSTTKPSSTSTSTSSLSSSTSSETSVLSSKSSGSTSSTTSQSSLSSTSTQTPKSTTTKTSTSTSTSSAPSSHTSASSSTTRTSTSTSKITSSAPKSTSTSSSTPSSSSITSKISTSLSKTTSTAPKSTSTSSSTPSSSNITSKTSTSLTKTTSTAPKSTSTSSTKSSSSSITSKTSTSLSKTTSTESRSTSTSSSRSSSPSSSSPSHTTSSPTSRSTSATPTSAQKATFTEVGCFAEPQKGRALKRLFRSNDMTPELCIAYAQSLARKSKPTVLPYVAVEYGRECYGGTVVNNGAAITSLVGPKACTMPCAGNQAMETALCGGKVQFNLYASGSMAGQQPVVTKTAT